MPPRSTLLLSVVCCLFCARSGLADTSDGPPAIAVEFSFSEAQQRVLVAAYNGNERRLRGDWETPDTVLLATYDAWFEPLALIVLSAQLDAQLLLLNDNSDMADALSALFPPERRENFLVFNSPHESPWVRDYGPLQIESAQMPLWLDMGYFEERKLDDTMPTLLASHLDIAVEPIDAIIEGGALISNGSGLCAMSDSNLQQAGISNDDDDAIQWLLEHIGCQVLASLPALRGEATGHADMIAQFLSPTVVAIATVDAELFPQQAQDLDNGIRVLTLAAAELGIDLEVLRVPMHIEDQVFYSYINGTRLQNQFLVPSYSRVPIEIEHSAFKQLSLGMPELELVPIPADPIIALGGAIHCMAVGLFLRVGE